RPGMPPLRPRAAVRKLRLVGCLAARALLPMADPERDRGLRAAIDAAERLADRRGKWKELLRARQGPDGWWTVASPRAIDAAWGASDKAHEGRMGRIAGMIRCVFGGLFRPVTPPRTCLTADPLSLAQAAYEERALPSGQLDPARLLVLADALEEA